MTTHNITKADIDNLSINGRKPRIVREYRDKCEVVEALMQRLTVRSLADLADARRALTQTICDVLGVTRREVKLPQQHLVLLNADNMRLTRLEYSMRERVQQAGDGALFHIEVSPDVQRGVAQAWEAKR